MYPLNEGRYETFVDRMARSRPVFRDRIMERVRHELPPARLLPVQAELRELVDKVLYAAFASMRSGEPLDDETVVLMRATGDRWAGGQVPFSTIVAIANAAARAAIEVTRELAAGGEAQMTLDMMTRGLVVAQEVLAACAAGYSRRLLEAAKGVVAVVRSRPDVALQPTPRQVLQLVSEGRTNLEIAAQLHVSKQTVNYHVRAMMRTVGAVNRTALVTRAFEQGLLPSD